MVEKQTENPFIDFPRQSGLCLVSQGNCQNRFHMVPLQPDRAHSHKAKNTFTLTQGTIHKVAYYAHPLVCLHTQNARL